MEAVSGDAVQEIRVTKRKRGKTRGAKWKKIREQKAGKVEVKIPRCLRRAVGENAQQFITETSYLVKQCLPLKAINWDDIDQDSKAKLMSKVKEMYVFPNESYVNTAIVRMLKKHYRNWRYNLRLIYRKFTTDQERLSNCPNAIDFDDWKWLVEHHWGTQKFRHISEVNKKNRGLQTMGSCVGTKSVVRTLHDMRNSNDDQDTRPEYMKLFQKEKTKKNGEWVDGEAEAAYKKMEGLHDAQIKEHGVDDLTTIEVFTQVLGHRSGHVRGMGEGPAPLKRVNQDTSHNCVNEAEMNERLEVMGKKKEDELNQRFEELAKKKEDEMNQRLEEISRKREDEIRKQVKDEFEACYANKFRDMQLLMTEKLASMLEAQTSTSKNQSSSPTQETMHAVLDKTGNNQPINKLSSAAQETMEAISGKTGEVKSKKNLSSPTRQTMQAMFCKKGKETGKDQLYYTCHCGELFMDAELYMIHLRNPAHPKNPNVGKTLGIPSAINTQVIKRKIKQEKVNQSLLNKKY